VYKRQGITCTSTNCAENLHCFLADKRRKRSGAPPGCCRSCGADLVDWDRVQRRDIADAAFTFENLRYEYIRHEFWCRPFDQHAVNHALRKGRTGLQVAAEQRIRNSVGPGTPPGTPTFDGRQTPPNGNVLFYAQHATATCCRRCIAEWHGIPRDQDLTEEQIAYLSGLLMRYVEERLPDLPDEGQKVPPIRAGRPGTAQQGELDL